MAFLVVACGKKGPPLPPLVKLPVPPPDLAAERRGATVDLHFTVPVANTDGSRPANVASVDVYAITAPASLTAPAAPGVPPALTDADILKSGTKVGSVPVKAPKDPNQTVEEDEADADVDPPEGKGLDQGAMARIAEELMPDALTPVDPSKGSKPQKKPPPVFDEGPLLPAPASAVPFRTYVAVGFSTRGKKGPFSRRITVPLVAPPASPSNPDLTYDETQVTVTWEPAAGDPEEAQQDTDTPLLPSRPIGYVRPPIGYNVYELPDESTSAAPVKLTKAPIPKPPFTDTRMTWGAYRCYEVRAVQTVSGTAIESDAPPPVCDTLVDTFPPAAPKSLQAVPSEGAISLIWEPNSEKDLAGYVVLRAIGDGDLQQITLAPMTSTTFKDNVQANVRYSYAVRALDKAGNASPTSNRVEEIAR